MKTFRRLWLLLPLLMAGCTKQDATPCPPKTNTTIYFNLIDVAERDVFSALVDQVDLFVYDANGRQVSRTAVPKGELSQFAGKRLKLNPGQYTVVAWANAASPLTHYVTAENSSYLDNAQNYLQTAATRADVAENGDPLYYAPKGKGAHLTVTVPETGQAQATAEMRPAHVKLEVTVTGYDPKAHGQSNLLTMEVTDLTSRYGFGMNAYGEKVSYVQQVSNAQSVEKAFVAMFNIPVFDRNTGTEIRITEGSGKMILPAISLKEILGDKINLETLWHLPIKVAFTEENGLLSVSVKVDLPEWGEGDVRPNI